MSAPIVVVGMSVREVMATETLRGWADGVGATVAHLQVGDPSLHRELTRLADAGADRITLVGVSLGNLAPALSWLRRVASHWWQERPEPRPQVDVGEFLAGTQDEVTEALGRTRAINGREAGISSPAWDEVTKHRHQLLICRGPRCTAQGSDATAEAFVLALMKEGLGDDDVLITQTGCQFPCSNAPVVVIQPDDVWYGEVGPDDAAQITAEHLAKDRPVERLRLDRQRGGLADS